MDLSFGTRLREQRERQQVTLTAISKETKISLSTLESLERDDLSRWPGGIFRRAYIRSYAQAIGLEPDAVMREFLERFPEPVVEVPEVLTAQVAAGTSTPSWSTSPLEALRASLVNLRPLRDAFRRPMDFLASEPSADSAPEVVAPPPEPIESAESTTTLMQEDPASLEAAVMTMGVDSESPRRRPGMRTMKRPSVRSATANKAQPREVPGTDRDLVSIARLCTALGCARDQTEVRDVLEDAARVLRARGVIVWAWDAMRAGLSPVIAYGYSNTVLRKLPRVGLNTDNAVATAFRSAHVHVVPGSETATGAVAAPLISTNGCVGVVAFEFRNGGEQRECVRAFATILGAQLSTLVPVSSLAQAVSA